MSQTVTVSDHVYAVLTNVKEERDHTTYDSALREVLRNGEYDV